MSAWKWIIIKPLTRCFSVFPLRRSWLWSTWTVTSVWIKPVRRTARCPASETAHTHARNSGFSATSHFQRSSDHTLHTHSHTQRPRVTNQGNGHVYSIWAPGNERLPMKGWWKRGGWKWWYYLCQRSEGGVCSSLLRANSEERLPLREYGCYLTFFFVLFFFF